MFDNNTLVLFNRLPGRFYKCFPDILGVVIIKATRNVALFRSPDITNLGENTYAILPSSKPFFQIVIIGQ